MTTDATDGFVRVRGANENNLRNVDMDIPRNVMAAPDRAGRRGPTSRRTRADIVQNDGSVTAPYLARRLERT